MSFLKVHIYRNPKLLALAKHAPKCFCCGIKNDGNIVAAHSNMSSMGKGMGLKAADVISYICNACHDEIDGRVPSDHNRGDLEVIWALSAVHSMRWALENHPEVFQT